MLLTVNKKRITYICGNNFMSTDVHTVSIVNGLTTEVIAFHASVVLQTALT